jgi:hypothetical protein
MKKKPTKKDYAWGGIGLLGYAAGGAAAWWLLTRKSATSAPLKGLGAAPPLSAPVKPQAEIASALRRTGSDLSRFFAQASSLTGVPDWLIHMIVANEIGHAPYTRVNPAVGATGPGQITPPTAFATYYIASEWGLITPGMDALLARKLGRNFAAFKQTALKGAASAPMVANLLKDPEFNIAIVGLLLACLTHLFTDGTNADPARVVLGYNRGIDWSLQSVRKELDISRAALIKRVARADWRFPAQLRRSVADSLSLAPGKEARHYIINHLAPGGYLQQVQQLRNAAGQGM